MQAHPHVVSVQEKGCTVLTNLGVSALMLQRLLASSVWLRGGSSRVANSAPQAHGVSLRCTTWAVGGRQYCVQEQAGV